MKIVSAVLGGDSIVSGWRPRTAQDISSLFFACN